MSQPNRPSVEDVKNFWNENPLFAGESAHSLGSRDWFDDHARVIIEDGFAGKFDGRTLPPPENRGRVLDLGCGPGFWTIELQRRCRIDAFTAADLTERAVTLTGERLKCFGLQAELRVENAEALSFTDASFDHVNCQGVIHHTPDTARAVAEISRVLRPGGTASLSVYYRNLALRQWRLITPLSRLLGRSGAGLKGRGREGLYGLNDINEIVRVYDGAGNPIGKAYDRRQFEALLSPHFEVQEIYFHFFPARSLPLPIPKLLHRWLDGALPFLIYASVRKR